jgi:hypothetical protein
MAQKPVALPGVGCEPVRGALSQRNDPRLARFAPANGQDTAF